MPKRNEIDYMPNIYFPTYTDTNFILSNVIERCLYESCLSAPARPCSKSLKYVLELMWFLNIIEIYYCSILKLKSVSFTFRLQEHTKDLYYMGKKSFQVYFIEIIRYSNRNEINMHYRGGL